MQQSPPTTTASRLAHRTASIVFLLLIAAMAGLALNGSASLSSPALAQSSLSDRYGVAVTSDPAQARTLGLSWIHWPGSTAWALAAPSQRASIPPGVRFPIILYMKQPLPDTTLARLAVQHPGAYWYIGNEPNILAQDFVTPEQYAEQLRRHAAILKEADPTAKLVGPNVLNWSFTCNGCDGEFVSGRQWTERMRSAYRDKFNVEPPLDIWSLHPYDLDWTNLPQGNAERQIEQIQGMRDWLDSIPGLAGKPMWLTEVGLHWGYPGLTHTSDGLAMPTGEYAYDHVERYMRTVFGWLNQNAERLNIERWFIWVAWSPPEPWQTQWAGISLLDGPDANAPITRLGRLYRQLAGLQ